MSGQSHLYVPRFVILFIVAALLGTAGCAGLRQRLEEESWEPDLARQFLEEPAPGGEVDSLRGEARLSFFHAVKLPPRLVIMVKRPAALRLEAFGPLGQVFFIVNMFGGEVKGVLVADNIFFSGPATSEHLGAILPRGLSPRELADFLLGRMPIRGGRVTRAYQNRHSTRVRIVTVDDQGLTREITADLQSRKILRVAMQGSDGRPLWSAAVDKFIRIGEREFPMERRLKIEDGRQGFVLEYTDVELDPQFSDERFQLKPYAGLKQVPLNSELLFGTAP